jgi:hypothetical protein
MASPARFPVPAQHPGLAGRPARAERVQRPGLAGRPALAERARRPGLAALAERV